MIEHGLARRKADIAPAGEKRPVYEVDPNRFVVYGSRISGAFSLGEELLKFLSEKGVAEPNVQVVRDARVIDQAFYLKPSTKRSKNSPPKLPRGVILLGEMRQYFNGQGMSLDTTSSGIRDYVEKICKENGIPLAIFTGDFSEEIFDTALRQLAETDPRQLPDKSISA